MRTAKIIALDPGTTQTGVIFHDGERILYAGVQPNEELRKLLREWECETLAIEWIQAMGMPVGKEVFETCMWVGRFIENANFTRSARLIPRTKIKLFHCGQARAKDPHVVQALKDKYGERGTKGAPGYFYGVSSHAWQAAAVALYINEGAKDEMEITILPDSPQSLAPPEMDLRLR